MINLSRRRFIASLAALPFVGKALVKPSLTSVAVDEPISMCAPLPSATLSGGTFQLTYQGVWSDALPYNATATQIEAAFNELTRE